MMNQKININIKLFKWQEDCLRQIMENQNKIHVVKSKRQTGKSILMELILLKFALEHNNGTCYYVLPSYKQVTKVWDEITRIISNHSFVRKINNTLFSIKLTNGTDILFFSAEQKISSLQGYTCRTLLIIDEAAFISDEVFSAVLPWTNVCQPPIILISTPLYRAGLFFNFWCDGVNPAVEDVMAFDFCGYDTRALLSEKRLDYYRRTLPAIIFKQHYLGEFAEDSGSVFGDFSECLRSKDAEISEYQYVNFGIDWGTGTEQDETAITIITNNMQVLDIKHFNDKDSIKTIDYIAELARQYKPSKIIAEKNSIGAVFLDILRKSFREKGLDIPIIPFVTSNESKFLLVSRLQVAILNKEISMPNDENLKLLLMKYEMSLSSTNKPVYNAAKGFHDDILMSMMIALDSILIKKKSTFI